MFDDGVLQSKYYVSDACTSWVVVLSEEVFSARRKKKKIIVYNTTTHHYYHILHHGEKEKDISAVLVCTFYWLVYSKIKIGKNFVMKKNYYKKKRKKTFFFSVINTICTPITYRTILDTADVINEEKVKKPTI